MKPIIALIASALSLLNPCGIARAAVHSIQPREQAAQPAADQKTMWSGSIELPGGIKLDFTVDLGAEAGTISIPAQNAMDVPLADVAVSDTLLRFTIKPPGAPESAHARFELTIAEDGQTAAGVLRQVGQEFPVKARRLAPGEAPKGLSRPQEPKPPFPYMVQDVTYPNKEAGHTLGGTLVTPSTGGPFPAVVMITGSGPQDRDESLLGHKPFLVIADHLVRHGIAVLRFDDRGVGKSTGDFATATSDDFATDALAGVEFLKGRAEIDAKRIGLVGHSEGGLIAPMCASRSSDVAFLVLLAGTGVPGAEILTLQGELIALANGGTKEEVDRRVGYTSRLYSMIVAGEPDDALRAVMRELAAEQVKTAAETRDLPAEQQATKVDEAVQQGMAQLTSPWFRRFLAIDPRSYLSKVRCPVLALNGELDLQVPPYQNLPEIDKALRSNGNTGVKTVELKGLNHLFQHCKTGSPSEYVDIEETFAPEALDVMTQWIRETTQAR